jgi:hypothetical protein
MAKTTTKLKVQAGTDEVNFGETRFPVDLNHEVDVPDDAVAGLIATGGCTVVADPIVLPDGLVQVRGPEGATSISWGGDVHESTDGLFMVPAGSVSDLMAHGFTPVEPTPPVITTDEVPAVVEPVVVGIETDPVLVTRIEPI